MSVKGRLVRLFSRFLEQGEVIASRELSPQFRLLQLQTSAPETRWQAGDKVQLLLPSDDVRTYTPTSWSSDRKATLLVYVQGDTPASRWAQALALGQKLHFAGPQRSLTMPDGAITLVGDETSIAVAASYVKAKPGQVRCIFELEARMAVDAVLSELGLDDVLIVRRKPTTPRGMAVVEALSGITGFVGITGGAELIKSARGVLRAQGVKDITTKAYWVQGRTGLD
jgi:NADPH-dependent ferric siderophore reductase